MKKIFKIVMLVLLAGAVVWTFWFLWQKSRPVIKKYEILEVKVGNSKSAPWQPGKWNLATRF